LAVFEALAVDGDMPRVLLAAPTGKAAARLTESLQSSDIVPACYRNIEAVTLHRLLKIIPGRLQPKYHREQPLRADAIVIDEASMIDLPMMTRILDAVPSHCSLILLGDRDQLASVESGMVLGDICGPQSSTQLSRETCATLSASAGVAVTPVQRQTTPLSDHIVYLTKSHRSGDSSGINALANSINRGDVNATMEYLQSGKYPGLQLLPHETASIDDVISNYVVPTYRRVTGSADPAAAIDAMVDTCVLCALRRGNSGAEGINRRIESTLKSLDIIVADEPHYPGRPVMVTENSAAQNLFNGDIGITMRIDGRLRVFFQGQSSLRAFVPGRLPQHQTFYAMTVHKSQGSEYKTVVVVLPDGDSPLLTRELLYTGVTRARERVIVIANSAQLEAAISTRSIRQSGILETLWPGAAEQPTLESRPATSSPPVQTELDF
ncbi:MAG: exodeoxyribonuclease V subunit alpha, partial [Pseudomonadota bacterium]